MKCPKCSTEISKYHNPFLTVDILIECVTPNGEQGLVLIHRKNIPKVWAIPGGFVEYGESVEDAACREALEETSLKIDLVRQFHCYSDPRRDPRQHNISVVFVARSSGIPIAADDANGIGLYNKENLPDELGFDHRAILDDFFTNKY
ncbi:MAG: NUDIX domain-containing protein [Candidatus Anammoxibacter sp.]